MSLLLIFLILSQIGFSQPRRVDSTGAGELNPERILNAPALLNESALVNLTPNSEKICFDKIIKVKQATSRGPAETCLYINTETGIMAYSPLKPGSTGICEIKRDLPDFALNLISLKAASCAWRSPARASARRCSRAWRSSGAKRSWRGCAGRWAARWHGCKPLHLATAFDLRPGTGYIPAVTGGSSNGRTADSDSAYQGSNPCPPAKQKPPA